MSLSCTQCGSPLIATQEEPKINITTEVTIGDGTIEERVVSTWCGKCIKDFENLFSYPD